MTLPSSRAPKNRSALNLKFFAQKPNAGDAFSLRVAETYLAESCRILGEAPCPDPNVILLGSILHWADQNSLICGSGLIKSGLQLATAPRAIFAVRGPLTRATLMDQGIDCPAAFGDPGVLAANLFPESTAQTHRFGLIPHYVDAELPWVDHARDSGGLVIPVSDPLETYFEKLKSCQIILSSTLHGIIFAHAFGIPAVWVELSGRVHGDGFKFYDYYASLGVDARDVPRIRPDSSMSLATIADQARAYDTTALQRDCLAALDATRLFYDAMEL